MTEAVWCLSQLQHAYGERGHNGYQCIDKKNLRYCFPLRYWLNECKKAGVPEQHIREFWPDWPGWPA